MNWFIKWFGIWTKEWWICLWNIFIGLFQTRYEVTVSFNKEWGDADDKEVVEYRSAAGLNYIIKEL